MRGVRPDRVGVHRHVHRLEADLAQNPPHDLLSELFLVQHARRPDEIDQEVGHPLRASGDGIQDLPVLGRHLPRQLRVRERKTTSIEGRPSGRFRPRREAASTVGAWSAV